MANVNINMEKAKALLLSLNTHKELEQNVYLI
jgi:hypothetical protein